MFLRWVVMTVELAPAMTPGSSVEIFLFAILSWVEAFCAAGPSCGTLWE